MRTYLSTFFASAILASSAGICNAAVFSIGGDRQMGCTVTVDGELSTGDAGLFEEFLDSQGHVYEMHSRYRVCLDSPGGSYHEGVRIASTLSARGIGTAVARGSVCESACGIAFMGGAIRAEEDTVGPNRIMHPEGRVGFHAPRLIAKAGVYRSEVVEQAYEIALESVYDLVMSRKFHDVAIPETLLFEILKTPPSEMRYIETVTDSILWDVAVYPIPVPDNRVSNFINEACLNAEAKLQDRFDIGKRPPRRLKKPKILNNGNVRVSTYEGFLSEGAYDCEVTIFENVDDVGALGRVSFIGGGATEYSYLWPQSVYEGDRLISQIGSSSRDGSKSIHALIANSMPAIRSSKSGSLKSAHYSCWLTGGKVTIENTGNIANVYELAGAEANIVGQVNNGTEFTTLGTAVLVGDRKDYCSNICRKLRFDPSDSQLVSEAIDCVNSDIIWYEVYNSNYTGFVSKKHLTER